MNVSKIFEEKFIFAHGIMTATLTYTLLLAAIFIGRKALNFIEEE
jgi:hypothetical protein